MLNIKVTSNKNSYYQMPPALAVAEVSGSWRFLFNSIPNMCRHQSLRHRALAVGTPSLKQYASFDGDFT